MASSSYLLYTLQGGSYRLRRWKAIEVTLSCTLSATKFIFPLALLPRIETGKSDSKIRLGKFGKQRPTNSTSAFHGHSMLYVSFHKKIAEKR